VSSFHISYSLSRRQRLRAEVLPWMPAVAGIAFRAGRPVELRVGDTELEVRSRSETRTLPLDGIFQVFRDGDAWTILHLGGSVLTIPADAITPEQVEYLRSFAHRHAAARARSELNA
jgi:hypothetical protein